VYLLFRTCSLIRTLMVMFEIDMNIDTISSKMWVGMYNIFVVNINN